MASLWLKVAVGSRGGPWRQEATATVQGKGKGDLHRSVRVGQVTRKKVLVPLHNWKMELFTEMGKSRRGACFGENVTSMLYKTPMRLSCGDADQAVVYTIRCLGQKSGLRFVFGNHSIEMGMHGSDTGCCNQGNRHGEEVLEGALRPSNGGQGEEETESLGEFTLLKRREVVPETK